MRKHFAYVVVVALVAVGLLPAAANAQDRAQGSLPTGTFAALAERGDLEPGRKLLITLKLHQTGGYQQMKLKFARITDSAIFVDLSEDFEGLTTDLNLKLHGDPGARHPFKDPVWATMEIPEHRVSRIAGIDSLGNGALIGAGIGAGVTALPLLASGGCGDPEAAAYCAAMIGFTTAVGVGIGLGADAVRVREGTIFYETAILTGPEFTWKPVPLISKDRKGFMFVLTW